MAFSSVTLVICMSMLVGCLGKIELLPEHQWETRQDWPPCCQYSSVVRAFLCSACEPPLDDIPAEIPDDCLVVDLSFNNIPFVGANQLSYLQDVQYLVLANNRIGLIEQGALSALSMLDNLDLANNLLNSVPEVPVTVRTLELIGNPIASVNSSSLSHLVILADLSLSATEIGADTFADLNLESLTVSSCNIRRYAFRALSPNQDIDLIDPCPNYLSDDNVLTLEPFAFANLGDSPNNNTIKITISNTTINEIPHRAFHTMGSTVNSVDLIGIDGLTSIQPEAFSDTPALESITIEGQDGDNILTLYSGIMAGLLPNLKTVDFSNLGVVQSIHGGIFDGLEGLTDIYLDGLDLTYIPPDVLLPLEGQLENLNVGNNPFRCDCSLRWLKELLDRASFNWYPEETTCDSPPELQGRRFDELQDTDFAC